MNERIQELADEAEDYAESIVDEWGGEIRLAYTQKLAELIVKDCRDMFVVGSPSWNLLNEKLDHFGIEE